VDKVKMHKEISLELNGLYERKNHDYGDSFGKSFLEYGMAMPCIRLEDKLNRLKSLTRADAEVMDETIDDTLMDLANYAIMTLVERRADLVDIIHYRTYYYPGCDECRECGYFNVITGTHAPECQNCPHKDSFIEKKVKC
jgi:hypothetical protein